MDFKQETASIKTKYLNRSVQISWMNGMKESNVDAD